MTFIVFFFIYNRNISSTVAKHHTCLTKNKRFYLLPRIDKNPGKSVVSLKQTGCVAFHFRQHVIDVIIMSHEKTHYISKMSRLAKSPFNIFFIKILVLKNNNFAFD